MLDECLEPKQARGAFGEVQLQDIVTAVLPPSAYEFQAVLSNGRRADCLLKLPNPPGRSFALVNMTKPSGDIGAGQSFPEALMVGPRLTGGPHGSVGVARVLT